MALVVRALGRGRDGAPRGEAASAPLRARRKGFRSRRSSGSRTSLRRFLAVLARIDAIRGREEDVPTSLDESRRTLERCGMALTCGAAPLLPRACSSSARAGSMRRSSIVRGGVERAAGMAVFDRDVLPEPDLVEALVRLGRADEAAAVLDAWEARGVPREVWRGSGARRSLPRPARGRRRLPGGVRGRARAPRAQLEDASARRARASASASDCAARASGSRPARAAGGARDLRAARGGAVDRARALRAAGDRERLAGARSRATS